MKSDLIQKINGRDIDLTGVYYLIKEGKKPQAVKQLCAIAKVTLTESKAIIKILDQGSIEEIEPFRKEVLHMEGERILIKKSQDKVSIFYTKDGVKTEVDPEHQYWARVKDLSRGNVTVSSYEKAFGDPTWVKPKIKNQNASTTKEVTKDPNQEKRKKQKTRQYAIMTLVAMGVAIIAGLIYYFSSF